MRINLLPWRERYAKRRLQLLYGIGVATMAVVLLCVWGLHLWIQLSIRKIQIQVDVNKKKLETLAAQYDLPLTQKTLKQAVIILKKSRVDSMRVLTFLNQLGQLVPKNGYLQSLTRDHDRIELEGEAAQSADIHLLVSRLEQVPFFGEVAVGKIKGNDGLSFTIQIRVKK